MAYPIPAIAARNSNRMSPHPMATYNVTLWGHSVPVYPQIGLYSGVIPLRTAQIEEDSSMYCLLTVLNEKKSNLLKKNRGKRKRQMTPQCWQRWRCSYRRSVHRKGLMRSRRKSAPDCPSHSAARCQSILMNL